MATHRPGRAFWLLAACGMLSACFSVDLDELGKEPPKKQRYLLEVQVPRPPAPAARRASKPVLLVETVHAAPPYDARQFVYRTGEHTHEQDYYNEFLIAPAEQLTQIARRWMRAQSGFALVIGPDSQVIPDHWLALDLVELRGDFRDPDQPHAVVGLRANVVRRAGAERELAFSQDYSKRISVADTTPTALAAGYSSAVTALMGELANDLTAVAKGQN